MPENVEKIRKTISRNAATQTNSGKQKRRLKGDRHVADKKYKGKVRYPKQKRVSKRIKNLLDGIPS